VRFALSTNWFAAKLYVILPRTQLAQATGRGLDALRRSITTMMEAEVSTDLSREHASKSWGDSVALGLVRPAGIGLKANGTGEKTWKPRWSILDAHSKAIFAHVYVRTYEYVYVHIYIYISIHTYI